VNEKLRKRKDFIHIARKGFKWATPTLIVQAASSPAISSERHRVGLTTTLRVLKNSVSCNRAKRRLRQAAQQIMPYFAQPKCDYVLIARKSTLTCSFSALLEDLKSALIHLKEKTKR
jgi:ribonuclease P protein component